MSDTLGIISELIKASEFQLSAHAVRELSADGIVILPLVERIDDAVVVEDYPEYHKGPCVLVLQSDEFGRPVHLLWGIPKVKKDRQSW
jgi:hypothetical protein